MNQQQNIPEPTPPPGGPSYEGRDVNVSRVAVIGLVFIILLVVSVVIVDQIFILSSEKEIEDVVLKPQSAALRELRAREDEVLKSYKILDPQKRIYQIPIDRAMQVLADEAYKNPSRPAGEPK